jgi:hypothetical protein
MGHLIGLGNNSLCNTVMRGTQTDGTRLVDSVQPNDVARVNAQFANRDNCGTFTISQDNRAEQTEVPGDVGDPCENNSQCSGNLTCVSGACQGNCDPAGEGWCSAHEGDWIESTCTCHYSPIVVDVAGDGFSLTDNLHGVRFDLDRDGIAEQLSWTAPGADDAFLVLDRNQNGVVDNGDELFGNFTAQEPPATGERRNGFRALVVYDSPANGGNGDGLMTQSDSIFSQLRLWQDQNHNGISEPSELHGLLELGVATIECNYKESKRTDGFGNIFRYRAKVKDLHGSQVGRWAWDVLLHVTP